MSEATARIRINRLLEEAGWRFFDEDDGPANVRLEAGVKLKRADLDALGADFEHAKNGRVDFLLLDGRGRPFVVLEAKRERLNPLTGKEQARRYARSLDCRFVILSNGNLHYFWDLERGNPNVVAAFPKPDAVAEYERRDPPDRGRLAAEPVGADYIALTQRPGYASEAAWRNEAERAEFIRARGLRFLRPYQTDAIHALQRAARDGADRDGHGHGQDAHRRRRDQAVPHRLLGSGAFLPEYRTSKARGLVPAGQLTLCPPVWENTCIGPTEGQRPGTWGATVSLRGSHPSLAGHRVHRPVARMADVGAPSTPPRSATTLVAHERSRPWGTIRSCRPIVRVSMP